MAATTVIGNRKVTVTLDDPQITADDAGEVTAPVLPYLFELPEVFTEPTLVTGWYLPNRFTVEGFGDRITIEVGRVPHGSVQVLECTAIEVKPAAPGQAIELDARLPLAGITELAVIASQAVCVAYPPGYIGDVLGADLKSLAPPGFATLKVPQTDWGHVEVVAWGSQANTAKVRAMMGKAKPTPPKKRGLVTDEVLREVAKVYADAPARERYETIARFLRKRVGHKYEYSGIKEIVRRATDAGYITKPKPKPNRRGKR